MSKTAKISAGIVFLGVVAIALIITARNSGNSTSSLGQAVDTSGEAQPVNIIKYSDYQCPYCKNVLPLEEQIKNEFGDLVTFEFRHFPLSGHQFADLAARAAEAARIQGEFEAMHDRIFDGQEEWSMGNADQMFAGYAQEIGLDMEQYREDLDSEEVRSVIDRHVAEGQRRLVRGTPTYFFNGQIISTTPSTYPQFKALVEMFVYR